jgi:hypothetical protein
MPRSFLLIDEERRKRVSRGWTNGQKGRTLIRERSRHVLFCCCGLSGRRGEVVGMSFTVTHRSNLLAVVLNKQAVGWRSVPVV